jgi:hypothetical protein
MEASTNFGLTSNSVCPYLRTAPEMHFAVSKRDLGRIDLPGALQRGYRDKPSNSLLEIQVIKSALSWGCLLLLVASLGIRQQQQGQRDACGFIVQGEASRLTVAGPDNIAQLVHVVEQPDSPIEIVSVDLQGTSLSVSDEEYTTQYAMQSCATYIVHNRSDRNIKTLDLELLVSSGDGGSTHRARSSSPLASGQTVEVKACPGTLAGTAPRKSHLGLLVSVESVDFGDCFYRPSQRIPHSLGVIPEWSAR